MHRNFTVTFYTGGVSIEDWENLTPEQQKQALSKEWKIRWWYRNPATGKLERQTDVKRGVNRLKTMEERLAMMKAYQKALVSVLKEGINPYSHPEEEESDKNQESRMTAGMAINHALEIKKATSSPQYYPQFAKRIDLFVEFLERKGLVHMDVQLISRRVVSDFLDEILQSTSPRTRNNYRADLSSIFTILSDKFIIESNFIKNDIGKLKTQAKLDRRFSRKQLKIISEHLNANDPVFLLFIKMMSYNFMRPVEIVRLKVGDIDLSAREVYFQQKTKHGKTKYLPNIYFEELKNLIDGFPDDHFIFTPERVPSLNESTEKTRRDYWSKQFTKVKKELGFGPDYTLYSFRHTYITGTYVVLRKKKGMAESEAINYLMKITGHTSVEGIRNYIHANDADKPDDWSELIDFKL